MATGAEPTSPLPPTGGSPEVEHRPAAVAPPVQPIANLIQDAVPNGDAEPTDDSPTIISSRLPRLAGRSEEALTTTLRGRRLAHFELRDAIGVGGMAAVIRALDTELDRTVALKVLPPEMAADPENIRRFHQEARAAARLDHENIARVFYCGEDQGLHFIAFEYVEGENLRAILDRRGRLSVSESIHYMLQIATGLLHAAARGVVHRDIKPSNIIITPTGRAKLVDMGLARSQERRGDGGLTQSGVTLGTFDYISPEQALEPRDADVRSDIYSLGCTFYHMLTGQTPVPEGTAAKKLHHHQHVAPTDPRQINPEIPDEVAAILAKMMAKDPADRYQRAEQLVQHLIFVAQKLGAGSEVPEGMLFVEAPILSPPRTRPAVVGVIAAAAVVGLILLLTWLSGPTSSPNSGRDGPKDRRIVTGPERKDPVKDADTNIVKEKESPSPNPGRGGSILVRDAKGLAEALKTAGEVELAAADDFLEVKRDPESDEMPRLVFEGRKLSIKPSDYGHPPTLFLAYDPNAKGVESWAILTIEGEGDTDVKIWGMRFRIDAFQSHIPMAAVAVRKKSGRVRISFQECEFIQEGWPLDLNSRHLTSVEIVSAGSKQPVAVEFEDCYFRGGHDAVAVSGPTRIVATNCAFGPHDALFRLRGAGVPADSPAVTLNHCSAFLQSGAMFDLDDSATRRLVVGNSLVAAPLRKPSDAPVLIRQAGESNSFRFDCKRDAVSRNCYYNLAAYVVKGPPTPARVTTLSAFKEQPGVQDSDQSQELDKSPLRASDPLGLLAGPNPKDAFLVNVMLPQLRLSNPDRPEEVPGVVGVERCTWGPSYDTAELAKKFKPLAVANGRTKTVDPTVTKSNNDVYPSLAQALGEAQPGDEILIKYDGPRPLAVDPVLLEKVTDVTIKPAQDCHPVLTLGRTRDQNAYLLRVFDGRLKLKNLEFRLQPSNNPFETQTLVQLVGKGQCIFEDCVITLEETPAVQIYLVTITELQAMMPMEPAPARPQVPKVRFENCFVRGKGDGVLVRGSRQVTVEAEKSLFALDGSFLIVEASAKEIAPNPPSTVALKQTTTYLTEHLVVLRPSKEDPKKRALVTTGVTSSNCLFVLPAGKNALILIDGFEPLDDDILRRYVDWAAKQNNAYCNYSTFIDQRPPERMPPSPHGLTKWRQFAQEDKTIVSSRLPFTGSPSPERATQASPSEFQLKSDTKSDPDLPKYGVDAKSLPEPFPEKELDKKE